jgi:predicted DNA-binding transcriptional regulator YafY
MPDDPKMIGATDEVPVARVRIDAARAVDAVRDLAEERVLLRDAEGAVEVEVPCANLPAFRSWLLGFLEHAEVIGPADVRAHVVEWLQAVRR